MAPPRVDPLIGQAVAGYQLEHRIGEGGVGIVYCGRRPDGATAAVKVVRPELADDTRYAMTVIAEARAVSTIGHPSIVTIFDLGLLSDGRPYLVMELVDGTSLEELLKQGPLEPDDALAILEDLFAALQAAHEKNVLHRDIKPANIYLTGDSRGRRVVKLLDFGLARLNFAPGSRASMVVGTPDYMAPEQASSKLTYASDLYSVGVVAFRMLTGHLPFMGRHSMEVIMAHARQIPQRPSVLKPGLSPELDGLVLALLEKDPKRRPDSAEKARRVVGALRRRASAPPAAPSVIGDETLRPARVPNPFTSLSLLDDPDEAGAVKKTEPFQAFKAQGHETLPPQKPGDATVRDLTGLGNSTLRNISTPIDDDDEGTVTARTGMPSKARGALEPSAIPAADAPLPAVNRSRARLWAVLTFALLLGGGAVLWLRFLK